MQNKQRPQANVNIYSDKVYEYHIVQSISNNINHDGIQCHGKWQEDRAIYGDRRYMVCVFIIWNYNLFCVINCLIKMTKTWMQTWEHRRKQYPLWSKWDSKLNFKPMTIKHMDI